MSDNAYQQARIESLQRLADGKLGELQDTIVTRKQEGPEPARRKVIGSAGKETMDRIRSVAADRRTAETNLFEARLASVRFADHMMILAAIVGVALSQAGRFAAFLLRSHAEKTVPTE